MRKHFFPDSLQNSKRQCLNPIQAWDNGGKKKKKTGSEGVAESMGYGSFTEEYRI